MTAIVVTPDYYIQCHLEAWINDIHEATSILEAMYPDYLAIKVKQWPKVQVDNTPRLRRNWL